MQTEGKMQTADYILFKYISCYVLYQDEYVKEELAFISFVSSYQPWKWSLCPVNVSWPLSFMYFGHLDHQIIEWFKNIAISISWAAALNSKGSSIDWNPKYMYSRHADLVNRFNACA